MGGNFFTRQTDNYLSATTSHNLTWHTDTLGIYPSDLRDVWGTDENNVYAVGFIEYSYSPYKYTAIIHWDGEKWSSMDYLEGYLNSIYGFSKNDIWAVGYWQVDYTQYSLITHWDGNKWTTWKLQQFGRLDGVWGTSSSNIYAVGARGLMLRYDGNTWKKEQSNTQIDLWDIFGLSNNQVYAAGYQDSSGSGILLQYDGNLWKTVAKGETIPDSTMLYGAFSSNWDNSSDKLYLVGSLSYEGTPGNWKLSDIPYNTPGDNIVGLARMNRVRGNNNNNIFICGYYDLIVHWNGISWFIYNQFFDKTKQSSLKEFG